MVLGIQADPESLGTGTLKGKNYVPGDMGLLVL